MGKLNTNQQGFSVIEDILVLLALTLVCFTGWYVYSTNRNANTTYTAASQASTVTARFSANNKKPTQATAQTSQQQTNTTTVKIPELGIEITVANSIKDLTYHVLPTTSKNGVKSTSALFSTASLAAADSNCGANSDPLGSLSKVGGQYPSGAGGSSVYGVLVEQYPTYFIAVNYPNGEACSKNDFVQATVHEDVLAFSDSLSTIQPLN